MSSPNNRPPGLWSIVVFKLGKGILFFSIAFGLWSLMDNNLPEDLRQLLQQLHFDPERRFWADISARVAKITVANLAWLGSSSFLYAALSSAEALGLFWRRRWAGWLALAEGAFFIPIEVFELSHGFTWGLAIILLVNVMIVVYLYRNRGRLFDPAGRSGAVRKE